VAETTTTEQIATAVGVTGQTVRRWAKLGLLPTPELSHRGRRGTVAVWPQHALAQARWVRQQLDAGRTVPEVQQALLRGEFTV
jgi:DNA-binding transcriptional MerR regulator